MTPPTGPGGASIAHGNRPPDETYRATMRVQTPEHGPATLIVTRQGSRTWLTLEGSIRSTAVLTDQQLSELASKLRTSAEPAPH